MDRVCSTHDVEEECIKSRRMRWTGCVARMTSKRNVYRIVVGKQKQRGY
jgi:hypothetical protein